MGSKLSTNFWPFNSSASRPTTTHSLEVKENNLEEIKNRDRATGTGRGEHLKLEKLQIKKRNRRRRKRQKSNKKDKVKMDNSNQGENITFSTEISNIDMNKENVIVKNKLDVDTISGLKRATKIEYPDNGIGTLDVERYDDERLAGKNSSSTLDNFEEVKSRRGNKTSNKNLKKDKKPPSSSIPSLMLRNNVCARSSNNLHESESCVNGAIFSVPQQNDGSTNLEFHDQEKISIDPIQGAKLTCPMKIKDQVNKPVSSNNKVTKHGKQENGNKKKLRAAEQASPYLNNTSSEETMRGKKKLRTASIPSPIRLCNGVKVTMIDEARKIFVIDLLNERTCMLIRNIAEDYIERLEKTKAAKNRNRNGDTTKGWRTLYTYTKMDLPCSEVKGLAENITNRIMSDIVKIVGEVFGKNIEASNLRPRSWKEPHLLKYQKYDGVMPHTGVEMHYDGCDITWQAMLTRQDEYEGGGTYIRCIQKTVKLQLGQILVHPGELYHKGVDITHGTRYLLVCFMDGFDPKIMEDSNPNEDKEEYEKDVIIV